MTLLYLSSLVILLGVLNLCHGYEIVPPINIPATQPGIRYNPSGTFIPSVTLEMFLELNCGESYAALPILQRVADYYGNTRLNFVVQQLVLSYHRNAFLSTQGLYLIQAELPFTVFAYMQAVLNNHLELSSAATFDKTDTEVISMLGDIAAASTGIDKNVFTSGIGAYRGRTATDWKYAIRRGQAGTPSFSVNGVDLTLTQIPTFDEWIEFLDPIILQSP